jgi:hypothetical protein
LLPKSRIQQTTSLLMIFNYCRKSAILLSPKKSSRHLSNISSSNPISPTPSQHLAGSRLHTPNQLWRHGRTEDCYHVVSSRKRHVRRTVKGSKGCTIAIVRRHRSLTRCPHSLLSWERICCTTPGDSSLFLGKELRQQYFRKKERAI